MTIVERRCPRCAIRRTAELRGWGRFCFNCRLRWGAQMQLTDNADAETRDVGVEPPYMFGPAELLRLERYRGAVRNGVYSDWSTTSGGMLRR